MLVTERSGLGERLPGRSGLEGTFGPIGVSAKNKRCGWAWWVPFLLDWFWGAAAAAPLPRGERGVASCKPLRGEPKRNVVFALFGETASVVFGGGGLWRARAAPLAGAADAAEKGEPPAGGVSPRVCARARSATHAGRPLVVIQSVFSTKKRAREEVMLELTTGGSFDHFRRQGLTAIAP